LRWPEELIEIEEVAPAGSGVVAVNVQKGLGGAPPEKVAELVGKAICKYVRMGRSFTNGLAHDEMEKLLRLVGKRQANVEEEWGQIAATMPAVETIRQRLTDLLRSRDRLECERIAHARRLKAFPGEGDDEPRIEPGKPLPARVALLLGVTPSPPASADEAKVLRERLKLEKARTSEGAATVAEQLEYIDRQIEAARAELKAAVDADIRIKHLERLAQALSRVETALETTVAKWELDELPYPTCRLLAGEKPMAPPGGSGHEE